MRTIADASVTKGAFELIEDERDVNQGPAPHVHKLSDEAFYVLEGKFTFNRGAEVVSADPGTLVFVPRQTRHYYRALAPASRVLILYVPAGGFNDFMHALDDLLAQGLTSAQAMAKVAGEYDSALA